MRYARTLLVSVILGVVWNISAQTQPPFEQVLVPFDTAVFGGAGARWSAELRVRNSADVQINLFPDTCSFIGGEFPCDLKIPIQPGVTQVLDVLTFVSPAQPGVLLYVPIEHTSDVHFTLSVRDLNSKDSVGTTIPVVRRSQFTTRATLVGIPIAPAQRRTLRVYDPSLPPNPVFRVRVIDEATNRTLVDREYSRLLPPNEGGPILVPETFDFSDSLAAPELTSAERVTVTIERIFPRGLTFWPTLSVTSDRDNHFAIFTPN
jgi:hypothetical protein